MSKPSLVVGLAATRCVGKDTLYQHLATINPRFHRYSMADQLKADLFPFILQHFNVDIWTAGGDDKELVRPLLIAYGMCQRHRDPDHWIRQVIKLIDEHLESDPSIIPTISDVRFVNEAKGLATHYGDAFRLINLTRDGAPEPTDEEMKHFRAVEKMAHLHLHWGGDTLEKQQEHARRICEGLGVRTV